MDKHCITGCDKPVEYEHDLSEELTVLEKRYEYFCAEHACKDCTVIKVVHLEVSDSSRLNSLDSLRRALREAKEQRKVDHLEMRRVQDDLESLMAGIRRDDYLIASLQSSIALLESLKQQVS